MKDNKGFTLVELIAVVVVLAIIALIAVPAVNGYLYKADDSYYDSVVASVLASGKDYYSDYHTLLPKNDGEVRNIEINKLVEDGYIEPIITKDEEICDGKVYVKREGNRDYSYCILLKCNDKVIRSTCDDAVITETDNNIAILHKDTISIPQCTTYQEMLDGVEEVYKHNDKLIGKVVNSDNNNPIENNGEEIIVYPDESTLNLKTLGKYNLTYSYSGANSEITKVTVTDNVPPQDISVTFRKDNKNGEIYNCNNEVDCSWTNEKIVLEFRGKDLSSCGVGSGIKYFHYKLEGEAEQHVTAYKIGNGSYVGYALINKSYKGTIAVRGSDNASTPVSGNSTNGTTRYLMIDIVKPSCVSSGGSNNWTPNDVTITGTCTDDLSGCKENTINKKYTKNYVKSSTESPGTVEDNAGNKTTCPGDRTVKIDKTPPTASSSGYSIGNPGRWSVSCSDNQSGVEQSSKSASIDKTGTTTITCKNGAGLTDSISHDFSSSNCAIGEPYHCVPGCDGAYKLTGGCISWVPHPDCDIACSNHGGSYYCDSCRYGALNSTTCNYGSNGEAADDFTYDCTCSGYSSYCPSGYSNGNCDGYPCTKYNSCKTTINTCEFGYIW